MFKAQIKNHPLMCRRTLGGLQVHGVVETYLKSVKGAWSEVRPKPDGEAAAFYALNHLFSMIPDDRAMTEFEERVAKEYLGVLAEQAVRGFHYLLLICTRESRHAKAGTKYTEYEATLSQPVREFWKGLKGLGSEEAADRLLECPPNVCLGEYAQHLSKVFYSNVYAGGYGGPAWGGIGDVLERFVDGTYSAEMMVDQMYTLAHNNGPIFNKGMLYEQYTAEFIALLDVQRGGQMPGLLLSCASGQKNSKFSYLLGSAAVQRVLPILKDAAKAGIVQPGVDWKAVKELGALSNTVKNMTVKPEAKKHPMLDKYHALLSAEEQATIAAKAKADAAAAAAKKAAELAEIAKTQYVLGNETFKIITKERANA